MKKILFIALFLTLICTITTVHADTKNINDTKDELLSSEIVKEEKPSKKINNMVIVAVPLFLVSGSILLIKNN